MSFLFRSAPMSSMRGNRALLDEQRLLNAKNNPQPSGAPTVRQGQTGFWRKRFPEILNIVGATMRQMDDGVSLDNLLADQERRRAESMAQGELNNRRKTMRGMFGNRLSPEMATLAGLYPDAFAASMFEAQTARPSDQYGDLEQIEGRLGQRNLLTNQYDWAPQVPTGLNMTPGTPVQGRPDYLWGPGGSQTPAPGGAAARELEQSNTQRVGRLETTERQLANSIDVLNQVLGTDEHGRRIGESMIRPGTTGQWPDRFREWGLNQDAENLFQALEPVVANIGFEALAEMRRNSETGGALGNVAVREIELLQRTVRSLATTQDPRQLRANAEAVRRQLVVVRDAVMAARQELQMMQGGAPAEPFVNETPAPTARRLRWNPQTQRLENAD